MLHFCYSVWTWWTQAEISNAAESTFIWQVFEVKKYFSFLHSWQEPLAKKLVSTVYLTTWLLLAGFINLPNAWAASFQFSFQFLSVSHQNDYYRSQYLAVKCQSVNWNTQLVSNFRREVCEYNFGQSSWIYSKLRLLWVTNDLHCSVGLISVEHYRISNYGDFSCLL